MNARIARVPGEYLDCDQIEHDDDDGYPTDFAFWSKLNREIQARRAAEQAEEDALALAPVVRVSPTGIAA